MQLHSEIPNETVPDSNIVLELIVANHVVVIAADKKSMDSVNFVEVIESKCLRVGIATHNYSHIIAEATYIKDHFLEQVSQSKTNQVLKLRTKVTHM